MPLQFVATYDSRRRGLRMAEKTIVEKAAETVGYGLAMAEDVAGSIKTAGGAAITTGEKGLKKKTPEKRHLRRRRKKKWKRKRRENEPLKRRRRLLGKLLPRSHLPRKLRLRK